MLRTRWAAIGAAVAVTLGAGGIGLVSATSPSDASALVPIEPCRLFDTRPAFQVGPRSAPLGPNETFTTQATGDNGECTGIPASATGLSMNVTAVDPSQATVLTIWGAGARPNASSLNPTPGQPPTPNAVTSGLTGAGQLNVWNAFGSVHVIIDIVGYYTDHNHDDRYYTEAEVDAMMPLWGMVFQNGSIAVQGRGLVSVNRTGVGEYDVTFDRDVSDRAAFATDALFAANNDPSADTQSGAPNVVPVVVRDDAGNLVDTYFSIQVIC
jgi:hypothetical protein